MHSLNMWTPPTRRRRRAVFEKSKRFSISSSINDGSRARVISARRGSESTQARRSHPRSAGGARGRWERRATERRRSAVRHHPGEFALDGRRADKTGPRRKGRSAAADVWHKRSHGRGLSLGPVAPSAHRAGRGARRETDKESRRPAPEPRRATPRARARSRDSVAPAKSSAKPKRLDGAPARVGVGEDLGVMVSAQISPRARRAKRARRSRSMRLDRARAVAEPARSPERSTPTPPFRIRCLRGPSSHRAPRAQCSFPGLSAAFC